MVNVKRHPKSVALLAARMTSERLPHKALRPVDGQMALEVIWERLEKAGVVDQVVLCTSHEPVDDILADIAEQKGWPCFRGEGDNVLSRYYHAARQYEADLIVRAMGDNLFVCMEHLERQLAEHSGSGVDWSVTEGLPWGMKSEVISFSALERAYRCAESVEDSCDLTFYFDQPEYFNILRLSPLPGCKRPELRMTMDTKEDLSFLRALANRLEMPVAEAGIRDVIATLDRYPELVAINTDVPDRAFDPAYRARVNTRIHATALR